MDQGAAFTGGAGDDTFVATPTTLTILDNINGGAGTDVLAITDGSNAAYTLLYIIGCFFVEDGSYNSEY